MTFLLSWLVFASVAAAATIAPGPAFAHTLRTSMAYGRRAGVISGIGLMCGVMFWIALVFAGFALLLSQSIFLFNFIRYCGAAYLIYMGWNAIRARPVKKEGLQLYAPTGYRPRSDRMAFLSGVLINLTNPKAVIYFTAIFSQFITPDMLLWQKLVYAATPMVTEVTWFSFVALILTHKSLRARFMAFSHWVERICGGLMIALGIKLAVSKI